MKKFLLFLNILPLILYAQQKNDLIEKAVARIEPKCISWRRDIHEHPELGNREFRTAKLIATHLRSLGLEVKESVAKTGVVGILRSGKPGPVIALRADIDALPVMERNELPFRSKEVTEFNGQQTGVMHACGHDTHVAMLMSAAEILAGMKQQLQGTVVFVFQPSEEGPPAGEEGGAPLMVKEGVLDNPKVDVMFGLHIESKKEVGTIGYREGGIMAESDWYTIRVKGKQTHGAAPWQGVDPVVVGAQIINNLQTVVSRNTDVTKNPVVVSTTIFKGGIRENIIPESVVLGGTIRTLDSNVRLDVWNRIRRIAEMTAQAAGASAEVTFDRKTGITYNNPDLTRKMLPSLMKASNNKAEVVEADTGAEDFSFFAEKVPSLYVFIGGTSTGKNLNEAPSHHTPDFMIDESAMKTGIKAHCYFVLDYMNLATQKGNSKAQPKSF